MRWLACVLLSFLVATCGQKRPLTLPEDEASEAAAVSEEPEFRVWRKWHRGARESEPTSGRYGVAGESSRPGRPA